MGLCVRITWAARGQHQGREGQTGGGWTRENVMRSGRFRKGSERGPQGHAQGDVCARGRTTGVNASAVP